MTPDLLTMVKNNPFITKYGLCGYFTQCEHRDQAVVLENRSKAATFVDHNLYDCDLVTMSLVSRNALSVREIAVIYGSSSISRPLS